MINNEISDILAKIVALTRQNAELKWTLSKAVTDNENKTEHYTKK